MSPRERQLILSRFFNSNVQLIANMCPRCYEDCTDVRIFGINLPFLKQVTGQFLEQQIKVPDVLNDEQRNILDEGSTDVIEIQEISSSEQDEHVFCGFSEEEVYDSKICSEKLEKIVDTNSNIVENGINKGTDAETCFGFSCEDANNSKHSFENFSNATKSVSFKIYRKVNLKAIKYICNLSKRQNHRKIVKKMLHEQESRYFKSESNTCEYLSKLTTKEEMDIKFDEQCQHIKRETLTNSIKNETEIVDYESEYFRLHKTNGFNTKLELQWNPKKEPFKDVIPEEKPKLWIPPRSPHNLIEEVLYHDPWALLVATIFLNRTSCMCARPYVFWFLKENPNPFRVLEKSSEDLEKYFVKLGLQRTRSVQVWRMSQDFVCKDWKNVRELYGIGKYGENAYKMFCEGDFNVAPKDRFLRIYKAWYEKIVVGEGYVAVKREDCKDRSDQ